MSVEERRPRHGVPSTTGSAAGEGGTEELLRLLRSVAVAANEATTVDGAIRATLEAVCQATGWPAGHASLVDVQQARLVPMGLWHLEHPDDPRGLRRAVEAASPGLEEGLAGRVVSTRRPASSAAHRGAASGPREEAAAGAGLPGAVALPVTVAGGVVAVLEFYRPDPDPVERSLLSVLTDVGVQVGRVFERQRAVEAEQRRLDAERRFLSMATHDLRAPLTSIMGYTGLLRDAWDSFDETRRRQFVDRIARQASRMRDLVDDFLKTVRLGGGVLSPRIEEVDLCSVVRSTAEELGPVAGELEVDCATDRRARADPRFARQIVVNLLTNARKYGEPPVRAEIRAAGQAVELRVSDRGPGVPPAFVPQLFERFSRAAEDHKDEGTGLGLSIVKELSRALGGEVHYEPVEPTGARFVVSLPAADPPAP